MQRDESQPEPELQPTSKQEDESQSEPEPQPPSEGEIKEGQPEPEPQPTSESVVGGGQPQQRLQAPPAAPIPLPPTARQKRRQYFLGLGFGLIPLIVFLVGFGAAIEQGLYTLGEEYGWDQLLLGFFVGLILYIIELIVMIVYLSNGQRRFAGYGLLTAFLASPVIAFIGCTVVPNLIHP